MTERNSDIANLPKTFLHVMARPRPESPSLQSAHFLIGVETMERAADKIMNIFPEKFSAPPSFA